MRTFIIQTIGNYTPTGTDIAGVDWAFIFAGIILCISFWCFCKLILGLFRQ